MARRLGERLSFKQVWQEKKTLVSKHDKKENYPGCEHKSMESC